MTEINKMLSVMSLKVIIKVDTVITAAERERERERPPWRVTCVGWSGQLGQDHDQDHPHTWWLSSVSTSPPVWPGTTRDPPVPPSSVSKTKLKTGGRHKPPVSPDTVRAGLAWPVVTK